MTTEHKELLERLKGLHSKATPGPWIPDDNEGFSAWGIWERMTPTGSGKPGRHIADIVGDDGQEENDALFITELYNTFPTILSLAEKGAEELSYTDAYHKANQWNDTQMNMDDFVEALVGEVTQCQRNENTVIEQVRYLHKEAAEAVSLRSQLAEAQQSIESVRCLAAEDSTAEQQKRIAAESQLAASQERERRLDKACSKALTASDPEADWEEIARELQEALLPDDIRTALQSTPSDAGREGWLPIDLNDPQVVWILSLMCFQCGPIAHVLQRNGFDIERKAEAEQAAVMVWLLRKYHEWGKPGNWRERIDTELNAMEKARKASLSTQPPASPAGDVKWCHNCDGEGSFTDNGRYITCGHCNGTKTEPSTPPTQPKV